MLTELMYLKKAETRSICAENPTGAKGAGAKAEVDQNEEHPARELGKGWKVRPSISLAPGSVTTLANIEGSAQITHIWMTAYPTTWRNYILRIYWDGEVEPSVETPLGDFFCNGWCERSYVSSIPIAVNPAGGFNCYWSMPFREKALITLENRGKEEEILFYQIDYEITEVPEDAVYFHAQFHRTNPLPYKTEYTIVDQIKGAGHYVGTYLAWGVNQNGWWGEGEVKMYLDGDKEYPTICSTGTEDYFGGAWNFEQNVGAYSVFSNLYSGMHQVIRPDGLYRANTRFGLYRFHLMDPVRFKENMKVTIQALGWRSEGRFLPRQDDIASVAYWYQTEPHNPFYKLQDKDELEVI